VPSAEYYLKQAELAARLALAESDPEKVRAMHILALEHYDKADKANLLPNRAVGSEVQDPYSLSHNDMIDRHR
jgi:hypothetical protein